MEGRKRAGVGRRVHDFGFCCDKPTPTRDVLRDQTQVSLHLPGSSRAPPTGHQYKQHRLGRSLPGSLGCSGLKGPAPRQPSCGTPPYFPSLRIHGFSRLHPSQRFLPETAQRGVPGFPSLPKCNFPGPNHVFTVFGRVRPHPTQL